MSGLKVRIGYSAGTGGAGDPAAFARLVDALEALGFDSVWVPEVLTAPSLDPLTALGFAAGRTSRLKLGSHLVAPGRNPARLAKELATLDRLSEGRLLLTFVIGLPEGPELSAAAVPRGDRTAVLDETLGLLRRLWSGERVTHHGRFFQLDDVGIEPLPHQVPLEVWFGGLLPAALRRCGQLADGWIPGLITPARAAEAKAVIDEAAAASGRRIDPEHFGANVTYSRGPLPPEVRARLAARYRVEDPAELVPDSLDALAERLGDFVAAGFSKFVVRPAIATTVAAGELEGELEALAAAVLPLQRSPGTVPTG